ncbi:MAG: tyrosine-type recombinase/integrase [Candidatus Thermoplasmatota archaeon]|nr:tyrosine-type recombinase/integrase [Candidatus Thermoplasmatota archaeon]
MPDENHIRAFRFYLPHYARKHKKVGNRYSQSTINSYVRYVKQFLDEVKITPSKLTEDDFQNYLDYLDSNKVFNDNSLGVVYSAINVYIKFLSSKEINTNVRTPEGLLHFKSPTKKVEESDFLTKTEIDKLLTCVKYNLKYYTLYKVVFSYGLRLIELENLNLSDIDFERNRIRIFNTKNDTPYAQNLLPECKETLHKYIEHERKPREINQKDTDKLNDIKTQLKTAKQFNKIKSLKTQIVRLEKHIENAKDSQKALFTGRYGYRMGRNDFTNNLKRHCAKYLKITRPVYPHMLRHSCGTYLHSEGYSLKYIQEWLRHKDIKSTAVYAHTEDHIKSEMGSKIDFVGSTKEPQPEIIPQEQPKPEPPKPPSKEPTDTYMAQQQQSQSIDEQILRLRLLLLELEQQKKHQNTDISVQ